jgi:hypothetical protein
MCKAYPVQAQTSANKPHCSSFISQQ